MTFVVAKRMLMPPQLIADRPWADLVQRARATQVSAVLSPHFRAHSASRTWNRSSRSSLRWEVWISRVRGPGHGVRTAHRSNEAPCAPLKTATEDLDRWALLVDPRSSITPKNIPTNDVGRLRDLGTEPQGVISQRRILGLRPEA